jgi:hypothetical protein
MNHESRINAALGKIVRNFNLLELNLGLCLRFLENRSDPCASHSFLKKAGMSQTIKKLKKILTACEHIPDIHEFEEWMVRAEEIRTLRNYYVHATWEYLPLRNETPLGFRMPPWRKETIRGEEEGLMHLEDLESDAKRVENVFKDFMRIRGKYKV